MTEPQPRAPALAAELRARVAARQVRQADLARVAEMSQPKVSRILSGRQPLLVDDFVTLCHALDADASEVWRAAEAWL